MNRQKIKLNLQPLNLHSASSVFIPPNITDFKSLQPTVRLRPLQLHSASQFHVPSISINKCFYNGPKVVLSPLKSIISNRSYNIRSLNRRRRLHPQINKCNARRCMCCNYLTCSSTIKSTVNGRVFSTNFTSDVNCNTSNIVYVLT